MKGQENQQPEQPPCISMESPCLSSWCSPSLMPRLSIPHSPDGQDIPVPGHPCHSHHCDMGHPQCCDKAISSPGMVPGDHVGPSWLLATQDKRVASSLCRWLWRASSSLQDCDGVLLCPSVGHWNKIRKLGLISLVHCKSVASSLTERTRGNGHN